MDRTAASFHAFVQLAVLVPCVRRLISPSRADVPDAGEIQAVAPVRTSRSASPSSSSETAVPRTNAQNSGPSPSSDSREAAAAKAILAVSVGAPGMP